MAISHLAKFVLRRPSIFFCSVRLTSLCSQRCLQCSIPDQSDGSYLDLTDFEVITAKLKRYGTRVLTFTGGEPALHPHLEDIFRIAQAQNFRALELLTNLYYPQEHQEKVIELAMQFNVGIHTSFDGFGEVADKLRGSVNVQATVERAMQMINILRKEGKYKHKPTATVVISALNIEQLPQIIRYLEELDWNLNIDLYRWGSANHSEQDLLKLRDKQQVKKAINLVRKAKNLRTPLWYFDGLEDKLDGKLRKQCPYLISPTFGSKFFVHENGDIFTCMNKVIGNLRNDNIEELFFKEEWQDLRKDFHDCDGCWNTCYTLSSRAMSYMHLPTLKQYILSR